MSQKNNLVDVKKETDTPVLFNTAYCRNASKFSNPGSDEYYTYRRVVDDNTKLVTCVKDKKYNIYKEIQEAVVGSTLKELIIKYENMPEGTPSPFVGDDDETHYIKNDLDLPENDISKKNWLDKTKKVIKKVEGALNKKKDKNAVDKKLVDTDKDEKLPDDKKQGDVKKDETK